jgi:hypothetical protein
VVDARVRAVQTKRVRERERDIYIERERRRLQSAYHLPLERAVEAAGHPVVPGGQTFCRRPCSVAARFSPWARLPSTSGHPMHSCLLRFSSWARESPKAYSARVQWCRAECVRRECLLLFVQLLSLRFPGGVQICDSADIYVRNQSCATLHVQLQSSGTPRVFYYSSSFISVCVCVLCSHPFVPKQTTLPLTGGKTRNPGKSPFFSLSQSEYS